MTILLFVAGLLLLIAGAEVLVRGASRLATAIGISPLVIGLTVVAFGTSSPELAVSLKAVWSDQEGISLGNIIGSNIFNILFILGLSSLIAPLVVSKQLVRLDVPLMIAVSLLVWILGIDQTFDRVDGFLLFGGLVLYIVFLIRHDKRKQMDVSDPATVSSEVESSGSGDRLSNVGLVLLGFGLLVVGSRWLVDSAVSIAHFLGVSEVIIALTIVAVGTSLPEVVTSAVATYRGEVDIAVGNVVGSNLFNLMAVLGLTSLVAPTGIDVSSTVVWFDLPVMIAVAFACLPIFFTGSVISRWEGALFLGYYLAYTLYLILAVAQDDALPEFSTAMLYVVIPLTMLILIMSAVRELYTRQKLSSEKP